MVNKPDCASSTTWQLQALPEMDDQQFLQWQDLLEARTGMELSFKRKTFLQTSLGIRMREIGCKDYAEYYERIIAGPDAALEWATLVDRLTVHETRFFRDPDAFHELNQYLQKRFIELDDKRSLNMWSVGCSSGEEPYGLAITAEECCKQLNHSFHYRVTGSDISQPVLDKARSGRYLERKVSHIEPDLKGQYFEAAGESYLRVADCVRQRTFFEKVNVLELDQVPMHGMDVIFCQNLLIYFRQWRRKQIVNELVDRLAPGGLLVLGVGEMVKWHHPLLNRVNSMSTLMYTRCDES